MEGLDEDTLLDLIDLLTGDARKYESLLAPNDGEEEMALEVAKELKKLGSTHK